MITRSGYTALAVLALLAAATLAVLERPFEQVLAFIAVTTTLIGRGK